MTKSFAGILADEIDGAGADFRNHIQERAVGMKFKNLRRAGGIKHHDIRHSSGLGAFFVHLDFCLVQDIADIEAGRGRQGREIGPSAEGLPEWEPYTRETGATMLLDTVSQMVYHHDRELMKLLEPDYEY